MTKKLITRDKARDLREQYRQEGKKVGFTSGSFDLLHAGHVQYLTEARALCDVLLVGLNSDASVRSYKNPKRPICSEAERAAVVAALEAVSHVFIFDELNNNRNIEMLKPELYIKAGDYSPEQLSSAPLVESYGGKVELLPLREGISTSKLIERVIDAELGSIFSDVDLVTPKEKRKAIFLDRDGTINENVEYLHEVSKLKLIPGAILGMKRLQDAGYLLVIVTNQPGIGIGYFEKEDFFVVSREILRRVNAEGIKIHKIYYCPHSHAEDCPCRKPKTRLIERAVMDLNLDIAQCFMIGDMTSDVALAKNAGCRGILLKTGKAGRDGVCQAEPVFVASDLAQAAEWILALA